MILAAGAGRARLTISITGGSVAAQPEQAACAALPRAADSNRGRQQQQQVSASFASLRERLFGVAGARSGQLWRPRAKISRERVH